LRRRNSWNKPVIARQFEASGSFDQTSFDERPRLALTAARWPVESKNLEAWTLQHRATLQAVQCD